MDEVRPGGNGGEEGHDRVMEMEKSLVRLYLSP